MSVASYPSCISIFQVHTTYFASCLEFVRIITKDEKIAREDYYHKAGMDVWLCSYQDTCRCDSVVWKNLCYTFIATDPELRGLEL